MAAEQSYQQSVQHKSAFANVSRSFETRKAAGRELQKALDFQEKQRELNEAQQRINKAKQ